jgi:hypothetical protein
MQIIEACRQKEKPSSRTGTVAVLSLGKVEEKAVRRKQKILEHRHRGLPCGVDLSFSRVPSRRVELQCCPQPDDCTVDRSVLRSPLFFSRLVDSRKQPRLKHFQDWNTTTL